MNTDVSLQQRVREILSGFDTGMLVTHSPGSHLRARPMAIAEVEEDCRIWFLTLQDSATAHEISENTLVSVICQKDHTAYIAVNGYATLRTDREKVKHLWKDTYKAWFPKGKTDPELVAIEVHPEEAEYWDQRGKKGPKYLAKGVSAHAKPRRSEVREPEEHARVVM